MADKNHQKKNSSGGGPNTGKSVLSDLRWRDFKRTLRQELRDIYHFYLDKETKERLYEMGRLKKWIKQSYWILKSLILKLSPVRRVLLLISLILPIFYTRIQTSNLGVILDLRLISFLTLLLILMLELKDKLLARDELAAARAVQFALIPREYPEISGWEIWLFTRPANEVGGDLVDYLKVSEERWGLALGDVAGKGLGAALLMAKLQATLRALAPSFKSLTKLGAQLNTIFCRLGLPNRFVSLVYIELKPGSGRVRVLNAGHLPPIVLRHDSLTEMPRGSPALGIHPEASYHDQCIELKPDDLLLVYSDGLTEARNEQGEFFGDQRLHKLLAKLQGLSAEAVGARLMTEVNDFIGDARLSDDLSLLVLKRLN